MSRTNVGLSMRYDGGLASGYTQGGAGFMDWIRKGAAFAKKHQIGSKIGAVADAVGATGYLDSKTGGNFSKGVEFAKSKGYGKRRKTKGGAKKKSKKTKK